MDHVWVIEDIAPSKKAIGGSADIWRICLKFLTFWLSEIIGLAKLARLYDRTRLWRQQMQGKQFHNFPAM